MMKRRKQSRTGGRAAACLMTGLLALAISACGSRAEYSAQTEAEMAMAYDSDASNAYSGSGAGERAEEPAPEAADTMGIDYGETDTGAKRPEVMQTQRKLVREITMEAETEAYEELLELITKQTEELGGYIESSYTSGSKEEGERYGEFRIRIPADRLSEFIAGVEGNSNVRFKRENVQDVTLQYVDLESHKKALLAEQERLLELIGRAESVEDIITVEGRLSQVRYQLESMESQLRTYDNKIDYSTVTLNVYEVIRLTPAQKGTQSVWDRIRTGWDESVYRLGTGLQDAVVGFVVSLPFLAVWLIAILAVILVLRLFARRIKRKKKKERKGGNNTDSAENAESDKEKHGTE